MSLQNQHRLNMRKSKTKGSQPQRRKKCTLHRVVFYAVCAEGDSDYWQVYYVLAIKIKHRQDNRESALMSPTFQPLSSAHLIYPSSDKVLLLIQHFRHSESEQVREWVQFSAHLSFSSKAARCHVFFFPMNRLLSFITENLIVTLVLCISADDLDLMLSSLYSVP